MKLSRTRFLWVGLIAALTLVLAGKIGGPAPSNAPRTRLLSNAKQLALAAKLYAQDHHGSFPAALDELKGDYIGDIHSLTHDPKSGEPIRWEYFGAGRKDTDPVFVLLASPHLPSSGKYRAVAYSDCSAVSITEENFAKAVSDVH